MTFIYPAVLTPHKEDEGYHVTFPDLVGCEADGPDLQDALENARAAAYDWVCVELEEDDPDMPEDERMCRHLPDDETIPDGAEILRFAKESRLDAELPARMRAYAREHLGWEQQFKPVLERLGIPWNETSSI